MSDSKKRVECPICGNDFAKNIISVHVNSCLNSQEDTNEPFEQNQSQSDFHADLSCRKKMKIDDAGLDSMIATGGTEAHGIANEVSGPSGSPGLETLVKDAEDLRPSSIPSQSKAAWKSLFSSKASRNSDGGRRSHSGKGQKAWSKPLSNVDMHFKQLAVSTDNTEDKTKIEPPVIPPPEIPPSTNTSPARKSTEGKALGDTSSENKSSLETMSSDPKARSKRGGRLSKSDVFAQHKKKIDVSSPIPLSQQMRPLNLEDYVGQENAVGRNKMLRTLVNSHQIPSMILWGPPGCGKTTLAKIIAERCKVRSQSRFVTMSATNSGKADVAQAIVVAKNELKMFKRKTILFIDEIHRFNKLQQDAFLPHIEDGTITMIGATTENPGFQINNALLSRCRVVVLEKLTTEHIVKILQRAADSLMLQVIGSPPDPDIQELDNHDPVPDQDLAQIEKLPKTNVVIEHKALVTLAGLCDGDARVALNCLQTAVNSCQAAVDYPGGSSTGPSQAGLNGNGASPQRKGGVIGIDQVKDALQRSHVQYDISGEEHYNCASALQKSIRGSDDNAAIYWLSRMLEGGEDPLFIARRLLVCASEDVGLADPLAMTQAVATFQACQFLGQPECKYNLAQCTTYLARAPKSIEAWTAMVRAQESIKEWEGPLPAVPLHLRNASNKFVKGLGYGDGYRYSHKDHTGQVQHFLPKELIGTNFFSDSSS